MSFRLIGIGEWLWDLLPGRPQMGGAPANFAFQASALGAIANIISRIGNDPLGRQLLERLDEAGISQEAVQIDPSAPTGTVTVVIDDRGQPQFTIHEGVAWDHLQPTDQGFQVVAKADAVCFGTLAQRMEPSRGTIRALVSATRPDCLRILDVNLRQHYYSRESLMTSLELADVLKVNDSELPILGEMWGLDPNPQSVIPYLAERFSLMVIAYTRGDRGSLLFRDGQWSDHPGIPTQVVDTVGAGDAFTAAMTMGLLMGWGLDTINERSNLVASAVAGRAGATPPLPEEISRLFRKISVTPSWRCR